MDLSNLKVPRRYEVRLYVIKGTRLTPMDGPGGLSDPFLKVRLGKEEKGSEADCIMDTTEPEFYKVIPIASCTVCNSYFSF